jgi:hypothetical protein
MVRCITMYYDVLRVHCVKQFVSSGVHDPWRIWCKLYMVVYGMLSLFRPFSEIHPILPLSLHFQSGFQPCPWKFLIASSSILPFIPGERCFNCAIDLKVRCALHSLIYTLMIFDALFVKQYKHSDHSHDISAASQCLQNQNTRDAGRFGEQQQAAWCCRWCKLS